MSEDELEEAFRTSVTEDDYRFVAERAIEVYGETAQLYDFKGRFFLDADNPFFDPKLAEQAYLYATALGHPHSPWHLARHNAAGIFGRIDTTNYRAYRDLADARGNAGAYAARMIDLVYRYASMDEEGREKAGEMKAQIDDAFANPRSLPFLSFAADCYSTGLHVERDLEQAHAWYSFLGERKLEVPPSLDGAISAALLDFFAGDLDRAEKQVEWIEPAKGVGALAIRTAYEADKVREAGQRERTLSNFDKAKIHSIRDHVNYLFQQRPGDFGMEDIGEREPDIESGDRTLIWYLELMAMMLGKTGQTGENYFREAIALHQMASVGSDHNGLLASTFHMGHNFSHEDRRVPIVAAARWPLKAGFASIDSVVLTPDRGVEVDGLWTEGEGALVSQEDVLDALVFAFGFKDRPVWPTVSIEAVQNRLPGNLSWRFSRKEFSPLWFGHTQIGLTFYQCDWLLGRLHWIFDPASITNAGIDQDSLILEAARRFGDDLRLLGGMTIGQWSRVMLRPGDCNFRISGLESGGVRCVVDSVPVRIDGAACIDRSDTESQRDIRQNDNNFTAGRLANYITDNFDVLKASLPVYARLEQLYRLMGALGFLRLQSHTLALSEQNLITKRAWELYDRGDIPDQNRFCF